MGTGQAAGGVPAPSGDQAFSGSIVERGAKNGLKLASASTSEVSNNAEGG